MAALTKIGREEGKRDCHSHLADAAPVSLGDAVRGRRLLGDKFTVSYTHLTLPTN